MTVFGSVSTLTGNTSDGDSRQGVIDVRGNGGGTDHQKGEQQVLDQWISLQQGATTLRADLIKERELREQSREFLQQFSTAINMESVNIDAPAWNPVKEVLAGVSRNRATQGFTPSETAMFVFSLKQPVFDLLRKEIRDVETFASEVWLVTVLLDKLGLYTTRSTRRAVNPLLRASRKK